MQQIINNGESGLVVRNKLNDMFGELYGSFTIPIKLEGLTANTTQNIATNTFLQEIAIIAVSGTPTVRIGTTPNGEEIVPDVFPSSISLTTVQQYFASATPLYITISGGGSINIRMDILTNFF